MEERKFIKLKKEEFGIKEAIRRNLGMGKISRLDIEYTPVGEKIIVSTSRPGLVIGRRGEKIEELTQLLKRRFKLENPHIEIKEIENPLYDAQLVADEIAMALERMGNLKFKVIAYRKLADIMKAGALGCELRVTGKLPSERAKSWRFAEGYLKKAGEPRKEVDRAVATALTKTGTIGIKVAIMNPNARIYDRIDIDDKMKVMIKRNIKEEASSESEVPQTLKKVKKAKKNASNTVKKIIKSKEKAEKVIPESKAKKGPESKDSESATEPSNLMKKGEVEIIDNHKDSASLVSSTTNKQFVADSANLKIKPEEDGTAMLIAEELEEGVPANQIDRDIKESIENKKDEVEKKEKENLNKEVKPKEDKI